MSHIRILYLASVGEALACNEENLTLSKTTQTVAELKHLLVQRSKQWQQQLSQNSPTQCAVNQVLVDDQHTLAPGDEVAFFPPMTGG